MAIKINQWRERYEVNSSGQPAKAGDELRQSPLAYLRSKVYGHKQGTGYRQLLRVAGKARAMQVFGIFQKLLEIAADQPAEKRGTLYNAQDEPATIEDLAFILDIPVKQIQFSIQVLTNKQLSWILIDAPQEIQGKQGKQGIPESLQEANLTKPNLTKANTITVIFEKWNSHKDVPGWKSHNKLSYEIEQAASERLKEYPVEDLSAAIDNYATILASKDHAVFPVGKKPWDYFWTLRQFLTRSAKTDRDEKYLYRFLPTNFTPSDFLTRGGIARRREIKERRQVEKEKKEFKPAPPEAKAKIRKELEDMGVFHKKHEPLDETEFRKRKKTQTDEILKAKQDG